MPNPPEGWSRPARGASFGRGAKPVPRLGPNPANLCTLSKSLLCVESVLGSGSVRVRRCPLASTSATQHQHHFEDLSPDDFERLVYWLVKRSPGEFDEVQWYGGARDKGRDVVAYKHAAAGREKWYIQCKRYAKITFSTLRDELDKVAEHAKEEPGFAPDTVVFATACPVPPQAKDQAAIRARELNLPEPCYWGRLELDERLKAQPETEEEFFGTPSAAAPVDLRGAHIGGSVVTAPLTISGGGIFVGGKQTLTQDEDDG